VIDGAYFQGLSARALARRFEVPMGTVKSRLARAICHLRERLLPLSHHHEEHVTDNLR
jgi:DNA-directed RNA polymerase specialized sigma24 family protein